MGEPLSKTREAFAAFLGAVESGMSDRGAAGLAGIERSTILRWTQQETPFGRLVRNRIATARARREQRWIDLIEGAGHPGQQVARNGAVVNVPGDWRATAWLAERIMPETYGPINKTEITGRGGGPVQIDEQVAVRLEVPDQARMQVVVGLLQNAGAMPELTVSESGNGNGHHEE